MSGATTRKDIVTMTTKSLHTSLVLLVLLTATPAPAAVLQVANNGLDAAACGSKAAPCRTISQAIDNAVAGDTIVVGPGRYGDLDRDGTLGEANEEGPETLAVILIDKAIAVESSAGAAVTVIDAAGFNRKAVRITASGARFGKPKKGFTLFDSSNAGVSVDDTAAGVIVEGNLAIRTLTGFQVNSDGAGNLLQGNIGSANSAGFGLGGPGAVARANLAVANSGDGFDLGGGGARCEGNIATGNGSFGYGVFFHTTATIAGGVAIGNVQGIFGGNGGQLDVSGLAAIANLLDGVHNQGTTTMTLTASNLVGNGTKGPGSLNCGTINENNALTASNVFWGAAAGPGDDPADQVCDFGNAVTAIEPIAPKPFKIKTKVPQL